MKKKLFFLITIFFTVQIIAQDNSVLDDDCLPVPWVNAVLLENGNVKVTYGVPNDTSNFKHYKIAKVDGFNPCSGDLPQDGVLSMLGTTGQNSYTDNNFYGTGAYAILVGYDSCTSDGTFSNVVYSDSTWYNKRLQLTVNVTLEDGENPEGTNVKVDGANCYYQSLIYEEHADNSGEMLFQEVMFGTYDIIISKEGYHTAMVEDFYLWQDSTVNIELKIYYVDIDEKKEPNSISIFPNPTTSQLNIQSKEKLEKIILFNLVGQIVFEKQTNNRLEKINTSGIKAGIYFIRIKTEKRIVNKRVVIN